MENFYKYLPVSQEDEDWGLQILHAGYYDCKPGQHYPDEKHPAHHYFDWRSGRVLQEYVLVYITAGSGIYNSDLTGDIAIEAGSVIVIFPNERHRYRPNPDSGWKEFWIGFNGPFMKNLIEKKFFNKNNPVSNIGYDETIISLYKRTMDNIREEKPGYQPLVSGAAIYMLGKIHSSSKQKALAVDEGESVVNHARLLIRANLETGLCPQDIAKQLMISYSRFRKLFKEYTGMAPVQYQIQLKLEKAKEELVNSTKSIKEIAYALNFESGQYFSNVFKEKTGFTPMNFRKSFGKK